LHKQLKELLGRVGAGAVVDLPDGIHSGLRREKCNGIFFYFRAPRADDGGHRHFWRYIDACTHEVLDNRYEIARRIACQPDEPRYIGSQDVFALQERVIEQILAMERELESKAAVSPTVDPIQQAVREELRGAMQRGSVDRASAKDAMRFLNEPTGRFAVTRLKAAMREWKKTNDDGALLTAVLSLASDFGKDVVAEEHGIAPIRREELELVCFEYVSS
jgi:hypothetical protein